jgi:hypothetical protein
MAITINGTGSITGLTAGGLPDGSITTDDLAANAVTAAKLAAGAGGKVLQVVQTAYTAADSTTASAPSSFTSTGCTASITPTSASSKILALLSMATYRNSSGEAAARIMRGSSAAFSGIAADFYSTSSGISGNINIQWLDSPNTTSSITYTAQFARYQVATVYLNKDFDGNTNGVTYLTLLEVAP